MARIPVFMLHQTDRARVSLRRYHDSGDKCHVSKMGYHDAEVTIGEVAVTYREDGTHCYPGDAPSVPHEDERWPTHCECGFLFKPTDEWQVCQQVIYRRDDTGEEYTRLHNCPPGAMWYADWHLPHIVGPDGHCLAVMTPGGEWLIDSRCSNCGRPNDNVHKCWVRHGVPPNITVDKNGDTCAAGGGSIIAGAYHGFLRGGFLEDC